MIFDFISKFDDYENRLATTLKMIVEKVNTKKIISFKSNKEIHHVKLSNILYVNRDNFTEKTKIVTADNEYLVRESLSSIVSRLDSKFYQTHRACFVNIAKIKTVDFKNNIIYFSNGKTTDYLSRNYKKGLRKIL